MWFDDLLTMASSWIIEQKIIELKTIEDTDIN